ncbi:XH/XS domain-containing protein [Actinidia rufa]|uniref:XH/XS domain-containing protein n=1 Tax=Actinidia rufa TaxID=165716 RepID=A0A7J0FZX3_9ERIC|nr:XH/XS domain-containing protein [Actinidia rufa]
MEKKGGDAQKPIIHSLQVCNRVEKLVADFNRQLGSSSDEESDLSESDINEYKEKPYEGLRTGKRKVKHKCKTEVKHVTLAMYLETDLANEAEQPQKVVEPPPKFSKFRPLDIKIFWADQNQTAQAAVMFDKNCIGFKNAMEFKKFFEADYHSKKEWEAQGGHPGSDIYRWFARAEDYNSEGPLGEYLSKAGDLKTICNLVLESTQERSKTVTNLANEIGLKNEKSVQVQ